MSFVLLCGFAATACASSSTRPEPMPPVTLLFSEMALSPHADTRAYGIDLDSVDTRGAERVTCVDRIDDHDSYFDPTEHGIDDALGLLASRTPPEVPLADLVATGALAIAVQVSDIDSYDDDESVTIDVGTARVPGCDLADIRTCHPVLSGGRPAAAQGLAFESSGTTTVGRISASRLRGALGDVLFPAALVGATEPHATATIPLRGTQIDAAVDEHGLSGAIGGAFDVEDMVVLAVAIDPTADPSGVRSSLEFVADLAPMPSDPDRCTRLSIGLALTAIEVVDVASGS